MDAIGMMLGDRSLEAISEAMARFVYAAAPLASVGDSIWPEVSECAGAMNRPGGLGSVRCDRHPPGTGRSSMAIDNMADGTALGLMRGGRFD